MARELASRKWRRAGLAALHACASAFALTACTETSGTTVPAPTLITARPQHFLGSVPCAPGALRAYVVTLTDVTPDEAGVTGAEFTSPPRRCELPYSFASPPLGLNHLFTGRIDGYDVDEGDLVAPDPASVAPGARGFVHRLTGLPVLPRWTTTCGVRPSPPATDAEIEAEGSSSPPLDEVSTADAGALFTPTQALRYVDSDLVACTPFRETGLVQPDAGQGPLDAAADAADDASPSPADGAADDAADVASDAAMAQDSLPDAVDDASTAVGEASVGSPEGGVLPDDGGLDAPNDASVDGGGQGFGDAELGDAGATDAGQPDDAAADGDV